MKGLLRKVTGLSVIGAIVMMGMQVEVNGQLGRAMDSARGVAKKQERRNREVRKVRGKERRVSKKELGEEALVAIDVSELSGVDEEEILEELKGKKTGAIEYVVGKFKDHDVVLIGEMHQKKQTCEFVAELLPRLYEAGVRVLGTEFVQYKNTNKVQRLISGKEFDREAANDLFREGAWPIWGFKEYVDILEAAWKVNAGLEKGEEKFQVIGLDSEWDASKLESQDEKEKKIEEKKAMRRDGFMAKVVKKEVLTKRRKAVVHTGNMHAMTGYRLPEVKEGKYVKDMPRRLGWILKKGYEDKVFHIAMHQLHMSGGYEGNVKVVLPMNGMIERLMVKLGGGAMGFDIAGTKMARLRNKESDLFKFQSDVVFGDIAEGYVYLLPTKEEGKVTWIEGFITEKNYERARKITELKGWLKFAKPLGVCEGEVETAEQLDALYMKLMSMN